MQPYVTKYADAIYLVLSIAVSESYKTWNINNLKL